jgi:hypothetical protein
MGFIGCEEVEIVGTTMSGVEAGERRAPSQYTSTHPLRKYVAERVEKRPGQDLFG